MLELRIASVELYDEKLEEFFTVPGQTLKLEHSLVSLAKWESKWEKPFLSKNNMTLAEVTDYIRCMTITQNVDPFIFSYVARYHLDEVYKYMELPMTATTFSKNKEPWKGSSEVVTAEIIYYWMTVYNIPIDCQRWHLNRLLTFINVCNIKNQPKKKMPLKELHKRNYELNNKRLAELNTTG